jgi:hypothetical protein
MTGYGISVKYNIIALIRYAHIILDTFIYCRFLKSATEHPMGPIPEQQFISGFKALAV